MMMIRSSAFIVLVMSSLAGLGCADEPIEIVGTYQETSSLCHEYRDGWSEATAQADCVNVLSGTYSSGGECTATALVGTCVIDEGGGVITHLHFYTGNCGTAELSCDIVSGTFTCGS